MLKKNMRLKGFTLVEIIVVVAIISILTAILVPSVSEYIAHARKKATVENGEVIYASVLGALITSQECYDSFYTPQNGGVVFESTADGECIQKGTQGYHNYKNYKQNVKWDEGHYALMIVARADGAPHKTGGSWSDPTEVTHTFHTWNYSDNRYKPFIDSFCEIINRAKPTSMQGDKMNDFPIRMPYNGRSDGQPAKLIRWLICYRLDDSDAIEIWAGDGHKAENGPVYRVYPNPNPNYDW